MFVINKLLKSENFLFVLDHHPATREPVIDFLSIFILLYDDIDFLGRAPHIYLHVRAFIMIVWITQSRALNVLIRHRIDAMRVSNCANELSLSKQNVEDTGLLSNNSYSNAQFICMLRGQRIQSILIILSCCFLPCFTRGSISCLLFSKSNKRNEFGSAHNTLVLSFLICYGLIVLNLVLFGFY